MKLITTSKIKDGAPLIISALFSALGLFLRFDNLRQRQLWNDEIFQLSNTLGAFKPFWKRLAYGDMTSFPGEYLLTYPFAAVFHDNKWGLAVPHILATMRGGLISGRTFVTVFGCVVILITSATALFFTWHFVVELRQG